MAPVRVLPPTFEQHHNGLGVNCSKPRISWRFEAVGEHPPSGWQQTAYEVEIVRGSAPSGNTYLVESSESVLVPWPEAALSSREQAKVRVRCFGSSSTVPSDAGDSTQPSEWSGWSQLEAALLDQGDWSARMITALDSPANDDGSVKPIRVSKTFELPGRGNPVNARLYITAYGCYHATINGRPVGDHCMAPGWQSYKHRLHYQVFDILDLLHTQKANTITVDLGAGWFASALAWAGGRRRFFGDKIGLLAQLEVSFEDGVDEAFKLFTDESWGVIESPIISSEIYNGESFDVRLTDEVTNAGSRSGPVKLLEFPPAKLISPDTPPVRVVDEIKPREIFRSRSGKVIVDFGQNLVGRIRAVKLMKPAGHSVSFRHAEVMENGELGIRPLRGAICSDTVICNGKALEEWSPKFTFHGFRYVQVTGWTPDDEDCPLTMDSIVAQVMHTDMKRAGWFESSHPMVNQLYSNAIWSMRGNFLSVPTDCPQRDERLGWTGDIQVFAPSASFLYNTTGMLGNWLDDLAAEQFEPWRNGAPPFVVPDVITKAHDGDMDFWPAIPNAVWDDVAVLLPWTLYQASGDLNMIRKQFESMKLWVDKGVRRGSDRLWDPFLYQLGDWLDPIAPPSEPGNGRTDGVLVADAYLVHVTSTMSKASAALGNEQEAARYKQEARDLKAAFQRKYMASSGLLVGDTQTALALAIVFGLFDNEQQLAGAGERLARSVRLQQFRVSTGFAGTPIITHALTSVCQPQLAYRMLLEKNCPSWMYPISMGATTIWERWDSMLADGSVNPGEMTSFNHYALGSVISWLHDSVGGISPMVPGWKQIKVRPVPGGGMSHAQVAHDGPYGRIECKWKHDGDRFSLTILVPPSSTAYVIMPDKQKKRMDDAEEVGLWVGSGLHQFDCQFVPSTWPPEAIMPPFWPQKTPQVA